MAVRRNVSWMGLGAILALTAACSADSGSNEQLAIGNGIKAETRIEDDADDRADHLEEAGTELIEQADRTSGATRDALQNEGRADLDAAAKVRAEGEADGTDARDRIERDAGVLKNGN